MAMSGLLAGRRAFVVGGGSGIGLETARLFAREGARVVVGDIDEAGARAAATALGDAGAGAEVLDVTERAAVERAVRAASAALGGLDTLVVTPFVGTAMDIVSLTEDDWRRQLEVMPTGTLFAFQAAIPHLRAAGGGVLLATSSSHFGDFGPMTHPALIPAYGAAKAAVELLVRTTARLHSHEGIRVNAIQPGLTDTPGARRLIEEQGPGDFGLVAEALGPGMPMGVCAPADVAEGFLFLASDYASYITGYSLPVDGGSLAAAYGKLLP